MSRFFVGQRVRIVKTGPRSSHLLGCETVIIGLNQLARFGRDGPYFIGIATQEQNNEGGQFVVTPDFLEPIQYDGMQPIEWSECLWQPEWVEV